jgi:hypothetical protein
MFEHGGLKRALRGKCPNGAGLNSSQCHKAAEAIAVGGQEGKNLEGNCCGRIGVEGFRHWFASDLPQTDGLIMRGRALKAWLHNAVTMTRNNGYSLGFTWNFKLEAKYRAERLAQRCGHHE